MNPKRTTAWAICSPSGGIFDVSIRVLRANAIRWMVVNYNMKHGQKYSSRKSVEKQMFDDGYTCIRVSIVPREVENENN